MPGKRDRKVSKQAKLEDIIDCSQGGISNPRKGLPDRLRRRQSPPRENHFSDDSSDNMSKIKIQDAKRPTKSPSRPRKKIGVKVLSSGADTSNALHDPRKHKANAFSHSTEPSSSWRAYGTRIFTAP